MMEWIITYWDALVVISLDMAPYLLLGFLLAGILKVYLPSNFLAKHMGHKNKLAPVNAAILGVPLPLCSCGVLPAGLSLHKNGAGKGASLSFLISTPQTGLDSILVTYAMLGLPFALIRPVVAFFTGIAGGYAANAVEKEDVQVQEEKTSDKSVSHTNKFKDFLGYALNEFLMDIAKWLIIGLMLAALMAVLIPDNFFSETIGSGWLTMLIVLAGSVPLYVCATASVPIAAVLMLKGLSPGAALVFLMAGPATNAATITVIRQALGNKMMLVYLTVIIFGAIGFGLLIDTFLPSAWFMGGISSHVHEHEMLPGWIHLSTALILLAAILYGYGEQIARFIKRNKKTNDMGIKVYTVEGMSCKNCSGKVEKNLNNLDFVNTVIANHETNTVEITGEGIDDETVKKMVTDLGYDFKGI